jgi:hypothetical protein
MDGKDEIMKRCFVPLVAFALALALPTQARPKKGDTVVEFLGGWAAESGSDPSSVNSFNSGSVGGDLNGWFIEGGIGRLLSDHFQITLAGMATGLDASGVTGAVDFPGFPGLSLTYDVDAELSAYGAGGRAKWYLRKMGGLYPFFGGQGFWVTGTLDVTGTQIFPSAPTVEEPISESIDVDGFLFGPIVGAGVPLGERTTLFGEYQYHFWAGDLGDVIDSGHAGFVGIAHELK